MGLSPEDEAFARAWMIERIDQELQGRAARREADERAVFSARQGPFWEWIPEHDANGHPVGPGTVNFSFVMCPGCPATHDDRGHHTVRCREIGCDAPPITPPGHVGPLRHQH
jgi:hypothetical protein